MQRHLIIDMGVTIRVLFILNRSVRGFQFGMHYKANGSVRWTNSIMTGN